MSQSTSQTGSMSTVNSSNNPSNISSRGMNEAMDALYQLQSKTTEALVQSKLTRHLVVKQMKTYLDRLSINQAPNQSINELINKMPIIHIAGTKGKGSTCAMIDCLMRKAGLRTGLFTSPHLISINERFRLNGRSIDQTMFLKHFWFVWDTLSAYQPVNQSNQSDNQEDVPLLPSYFRFLTLVAFSLYSELFANGSLDCLILEVGMGGRLDSTNVINQSTNQSDESPNHRIRTINQSIKQSNNQGIRISGITSIGYDHMEVLGYTLPEIAREKGGIIKPNSITFTIIQSNNQAVLSTLAECAQEEPGAVLKIVQPIDQSIKIGLQGEHQRENASLAVAIVKQFFIDVLNQSNNQSIDPSVLLKIKEAVDQWTDTSVPPLIVDGLAESRWGGRCEIVRSINRPNLIYFIDGAHTDQSLKVACHWFEQSVNQPMDQLIKQSTEATSDEILIEDQSEPISSISQSNNQSNEQITVNVLLFNTGHVRNPFELFAPIIDMGLPSNNQSNNQSVTQFRHFITCPFDHDRPHISGAPSIDRLIDESAPENIKEFVKQQPDLINQSINQSNNKSVNNWQHTLVKVWEIMIAHRIARLKQSNNQSPKLINQTIKQSINQSTNHLTYPYSTHVYGHSSTALSSIARLARANPRVNYRVFVVGSLYLVGNVLEKLGVQVQ